MSENKNAVSRVAEEVITNVVTETAKSGLNWLGKVLQDAIKPTPTPEEKELLKPKE